MLGDGMIFRGGWIAQQRSVLLTAPGILIAALAVGAAGGMTVSDLLASWSVGVGKSCNIKGNISIDTGERIFFTCPARNTTRRPG